MEEGGQCLVNSTKGVKDCLGSIRATPARFKTLTNFILDKFDDMCLDEVSIIATHAHTTGGGGATSHTCCYQHNGWFHLGCF